MKLHYLPLFIMLYLLPAVSLADPIDKVAGLIRQGNIHELSKLFAVNIEVTIPGDENVYLNARARLILDNFFNQNKPKSVKILHKINSNPNYLFGVLIVNTDRGPYRIDCTLKEADGNFMIVAMRIEMGKAK